LKAAFQNKNIKPTIKSNTNHKKKTERQKKDTKRTLKVAKSQTPNDQQD